MTTVGKEEGNPPSTGHEGLSASSGINGDAQCENQMPQALAGAGQMGMPSESAVVVRGSEFLLKLLKKNSLVHI